VVYAKPPLGGAEHVLKFPVEDVVGQTRSDRSRIWPVTDKGYFLGIMNREDMEPVLVDGRKGQPLTSFVDTVHIPHRRTDQPLYLALERMSKYRLDVLSVVHRADLYKLEGVVTLPDVLDAYGIDLHSGAARIGGEKLTFHCPSMSFSNCRLSFCSCRSDGPLADVGHVQYV
jgi:CBS domain-containing protein